MASGRWGFFPSTHLCHWIHRYKEKKVQVGGHAPTHRLNKSLNLLLLILQRSGKSSEVRRQKLVNHCSVWQRQQETNPDCGTQAGKASLHSWFKHLKTKKQDLVEDLTCPGELSMTCTSGILVDMFEKTRRCQKKEEEGSFFSVYCAFKASSPVG